MNPSAPVVQIIEVIGPAAQGKSIPLLCRGADGHRYYVKGQQTNRASLWREWICGHLAEALGLPLPPFALVQLYPELVRELPKDQQAIGSLPAFGSQERPHTIWLELGISQRVPSSSFIRICQFIASFAVFSPPAGLKPTHWPVRSR